MLDWIKAIFASSNGEPSSKRAISIIAFLLLAIAFMVNLFTEKSVNEYMWDGMITLVIFGIGFVASEKFSDILSKRRDKKEEVRRPYKNGRDYTCPDETPTDTEDYENPGGS